MIQKRPLGITSGCWTELACTGETLVAVLKPRLSKHWKFQIFSMGNLEKKKKKEKNHMPLFFSNMIGSGDFTSVYVNYCIKYVRSKSCEEAPTFLHCAPCLGYGLVLFCIQLHGPPQVVLQMQAMASTQPVSFKRHLKTINDCHSCNFVQ